MAPRGGKGKARATPIDTHETTPLLASEVDGSHLAEIGGPQSTTQRRGFNSILTWILTVVSALLFASIVAIVFIYSTLSRAPAARQNPSEILAHAAHWETSTVSVSALHHDGLQLSIDGAVGLDTDWVLGLDPAGGGLFRSARRAVARWAVSSLESVNIMSSEISVVDPHNVSLLNVTVPTLNMPLKPTSADGNVQMSPMTIPLMISPSPDIEGLFQFVYKSWLDSWVNVNLRAPFVGIKAGKNVWWMPNIGKTVRNVSMPLLAKIPQAPPGYPQPGFPIALTDILHLGSYVVNVKETKNSTVIGFTALANLLLPFTSSSVHIPARLPSLSLTVALTSPNVTEPVPFAKLSTTPSLNTTEGLASIMFPIQGSLLPILPQTVPPLTHLVSNYLSGLPSTIFISSERSTDFPITVPPIRATFPGPAVRPKILRGVSIKDMKLTASPSGEELVASGTLFASFALPPEVDRLTKLVDVTKLWPDTLVFDGPPPPIVIPPSNFSVTRDRDAPPLPDPLPERAFARIRAPDWLVAQTLPPEGGKGDGKKAEERRVTARIVEAPLEVLPGRDEEFTQFVKKILSADGAGALAGVRGTSAIGIRIRGLRLPAPPREDPDDGEGDGDDDGDGEHDIELDGLSFEGTVVIGRRSSPKLDAWYAGMLSQQTS